jgi:uncharacterized protein YdeI (BOF family)
MKKSIQGVCYLAILTLFCGLAISASAQNAPPAQQPDAQQSQPANNQQPDAQQPPSKPDQTAPPANGSSANSQSSAQTFTGTVVKAKSGDKYMFQEDATGKIYDIDHQDQVQKFDGKKVKVHGTLDPDTKTIHVQ